MQHSDLIDGAQRRGHRPGLFGAHLDHHVGPHRADTMLGRQAHRIADDDPLSLQPFDPALHAGTGPAHQPCQLRRRCPAIFLQCENQLLIDDIHGILPIYPCIMPALYLKNV